MRVHALVLLCVFGILRISAKAQGQTAGGTAGPGHSKADIQVSGKVITAHHRAVRGAIVTLRDNITGEKMTATYDSHGKYIFTKVFPGDYSLSATLKNKKSESQNLSLGHREKLKKDLQIIINE